MSNAFERVDEVGSVGFAVSNSRTKPCCLVTIMVKMINKHRLNMPVSGAVTRPRGSSTASGGSVPSRVRNGSRSQEKNQRKYHKTRESPGLLSLYPKYEGHEEH